MNEDDLWVELERHGFEWFDPTGTAEDPRHAFEEAAVVVGGHGAGLADLAFCRPGARVLELMSSTHLMPFYLTLALAGGLRYAHLIGLEVADQVAVRPGRLDLRIDPDAFRTALEETLG